MNLVKVPTSPNRKPPRPPRGAERRNPKATPTNQPNPTLRRYYSQDLLPFDDVQGGIIATPRRYARLLQVQGRDRTMLTDNEQLSVVRGLAALHNLQQHPYQWYCRIRRRDLSPLVAQLEASRDRESNALMRNRFDEEIDYILGQARTAGLVERDYVLVLTRDKKAKDDSGAEYFRERSKQQQSRWQRMQKNMAEMWYGLSDQESPEDKRARERIRRGEGIPLEISQPLSEACHIARSRLDSLAMSSHIMDQGEVLALLAEQLGGSATGGRDGLAPPTWKEKTGYMQLGERLVATLFNTKWPPKAGPSFLLPLVKLTGIDLEISLHYQPLANEETDSRLQRQEAELNYQLDQAQYRYDRRKARVAQSAANFRQMLNDNSDRAHIASLYVSVSAGTLKELRRGVAQVKSVMRTLGLGPCESSRDQWNTYASVLPLGDNRVPEQRLFLMKLLKEATTRNFTGKNTACVTPHLISTIDHDDGIILGTNPLDGSLFRMNPWRLDEAEAAHEVFLAITGGGKTMDTLIEALRWLLRDPEMRYYYLDPQSGTRNFTTAIGGTILDFGSRGEVLVDGKWQPTRINALDRVGVGGYKVPLQEKLSYVAGLLALMAGELNSAEGAALGRALKSLYNHFEDGTPTVRQVSLAIAWKLGLTSQGRTWVAQLLSAGSLGREQLRAGLWEIAMRDEQLRAAARGQANSTVSGDLDEGRLAEAVEYAATEQRRDTPILGDLMPYLAYEGATELVESLNNYVDPDLYGRFYNGETTVNLTKRFVSFVILEVPDPQKALVMYQIMNFVWQTITERPSRSVFVVDELGVLLKDAPPSVGDFISSMYKRARALKLRMVSIDQNLGTFLASQYGRDMLDNSAIVRLARQADSGTNMADLGNQFGVTKGMQDWLVTAGKGDVLVVADGKIIPVKYAISAEQLKWAETKVEGKSGERERQKASTSA